MLIKNIGTHYHEPVYAAFTHL